ncbi:MAG: DHH family phosphoesterase [Bdellovibrio sp.]|nr:DHH family phosphoesterase [Bdellovibrio sp.]
MRTDPSASKYNNTMNLPKQILEANTLWLSTHKNADGDGLGSEVAFYYALKSLGKKVNIIHNDAAAKRYQFLTTNIEIKNVSKLEKHSFSANDLVLIFDTHDPLLCFPLFGFLQEQQIPLVFIDHHVPVKQNLKDVSYQIDESACCTGEIVYELIKKMKVALTAEIATPLYASLIFDTQNFKFIRGSTRPFLMAAELIQSGADHSLIQKHLYDNWTVQKMNCLASLIKTVDYKNEQKIAVIKMTKQNLLDHQLESDDVSDIVDLFMGIQSLDAAIVIREEEPAYYKLSFRSRRFEVLSWAQSFNGGGHLYSSGAWVKDSLANIESQINSLIAAQLQRSVN